MIPEGVRGILLDVEGTTTPVTFVYETLFPFARIRLESACARAAAEPEIGRAIALLRGEYEAERAAGAAGLPPFGDGAPYAAHLMDQDRKSTGLKMLQGIVWEAGYRSGELRATLFDDVFGSFEAWRQEGLLLRIFSSGSILAQRLLFSHTDHGDLTGLIDGYHDTTTGPKHEADSYRRIARDFEIPTASILFLSDDVAELDAARDSGMRTGMLERPGNQPAGRHTHPTHSDFRRLWP